MLSRGFQANGNQFRSLAYKASSYLEQLLEKGAIVPRASPELNEVYIKYAPPPSPSLQTSTAEPEDIDSDASSTTIENSQPTSASEPGQQLLLTRDAVPAITALFETRPNSSLEADIYRAMEQATLRLQGSRTDTPNDRERS